MEFKWNNPFSKKNETVQFYDKLLKSDNSFRIPVSFYGSPLWDLGVNGLIDQYERGSAKYKKYLAYMLLNILATPTEIMIRQVSDYLMNWIVEAEIHDALLTNIHIAQTFVENCQFHNYEDLWNEVELLIFEKLNSESSIEIDSNRANLYFDGIISAYISTHRNDDRKSSLRRFRERYVRLTKKLSLTSCEIRLFRMQSYFYVGGFYHDIANSFLESASRYYNENEKNVFRLLHFKINNPGYKSSLDYIPPIASMFSLIQFVKYTKWYCRKACLMMAIVLLPVLILRVKKNGEKNFLAECSV